VDDSKALAVTFARCGAPQVLCLSKLDRPEPGSGRLRVRIKAASIDPFDLKLRRGDPAQAFPVASPVTLAIDAAGMVDGAGGGAEFAEGDEALGAAERGSYAECAILAALPTVGEAAVRALAQLHLAPGETVLIHGAGGSGAIAVQLAIACGASRSLRRPRHTPALKPAFFAGRFL
jgi:NADPH:quinone reductase-like Zn-dependent oxidoreductase